MHHKDSHRIYIQTSGRAVVRDVVCTRVRVMGVVSDFSERKRQEIETAHDGNKIFVNVRDEGPGINAALQEEVFQPFTPPSRMTGAWA